MRLALLLALLAGPAYAGEAPEKDRSKQTVEERRRTLDSLDAARQASLELERLRSQTKAAEAARRKGP